MGRNFSIGAVATKQYWHGDVKMFAVTGLFWIHQNNDSNNLKPVLCFVTAIILPLKRKGLKDSVPLAPFVFAEHFYNDLGG